MVSLWPSGCHPVALPSPDLPLPQPHEGPVWGLLWVWLLCFKHPVEGFSTGCLCSATCHLSPPGPAQTLKADSPLGSQHSCASGVTQSHCSPCQPCRGYLIAFPVPAVPLPDPDPLCTQGDISEPSGLAPAIPGTRCSILPNPCGTCQ